MFKEAYNTEGPAKSKKTKEILLKSAQKAEEKHPIDFLDKEDGEYASEEEGQVLLEALEKNTWEERVEGILSYLNVGRDKAKDYFRFDEKRTRDITALYLKEKDKDVKTDILTALFCQKTEASAFGVFEILEKTNDIDVEDLLNFWKDNKNINPHFYVKIFHYFKEEEKAEDVIPNQLYLETEFDEKFLWRDFKIKKFMFQELAEKADPWILGYFINNVEIDPQFVFLYRPYLVEMFKKVGERHKSNYAINKIFDFLTWGRPNYSELEVRLLIALVSDIIGNEETIKKLTELISKTKNKFKNSKLEMALSLITPVELGQESITNLQKFYQEKIEFQNYELNEKMNAKETALLKSLLKKDEKILEAGCGAGRLILELLKDGYDVSGFDFTAKHVEHIKKQNPEAPVFQGDWHYLALPNESKDAVYSLGRNILHDYSIADQAQAFRDVARVLKPGGKFIFDIPNREKGTYKKMVEKYAQEMKERGVRNFRYGAIYDSPDGKNFATRYAYSQKDIEELAQISGFRIVEIRKEELETGQGDENLYFVLEKTEGKK